MSQCKGNQPVPVCDCSKDEEASNQMIDLQVSLQSLKAADEEASAQTQSKSTKVDKVPRILREMYKDFEKIFEPRLVSAGPYHHGKPSLKAADKSKLAMANKFINEIGIPAEVMYHEILKEIQALRECYEEEEIKKYRDETLAWMLFVDGCALLQFIYCCTEPKKFKEMPYKPYHISFINQDLLLLENQLPFKVLELLTGEKFNNENQDGKWKKRIESFIDSQITSVVRKSSFDTRRTRRDIVIGETSPPRHLLELLRTKFLGKPRETIVRQTLASNILHYLKYLLPLRKSNAAAGKQTEEEGNDWHSYRNVNELTEAGIVLKPSPSNRLLDVNFTPRLTTSHLHLPPITIDDSIKAKLLNLIAYEMSPNASTDSEVTSYVCFLDSLIDNPQDVKELRRAEIIYNSLGSDVEVAELFNEIAKDLVANSEVYRNVQDLIQKHYDNKFKTWMGREIYQHFSIPWSIAASIGAIVAILLSFVQTFYTIFPHSGDCDPICKLLEETLVVKQQGGVRLYV